MNKDYIEPETNNVIGLQFSIMSPDEIRKRSVVEVTKHETYDKDNPIIKGLFDIRMGSTEMDKICGTCGQNNIYCPGHFGHIELARPIYHYQFISTIQKILKCTCVQCSKLLINKESAQVKDLMKKPNKQRWAEIYNLSQKITRCGQETEDGCGAKQPDRIKVEGMDGIYAVWNKLEVEDASMKTQHLTIETVRGILERITDEDVNILGLSDLWCRPEWMICSVFPIPPPAVRPSVKQDDSQRMDDDLTHKLCDIIKCNNTLKQKINSNSRIEVINDWTKVLQYHISTLVDNELPGVAQSVHRSGRALKAIRQRLKGKDGRIRNNLMGKRVDFSGRSVITPDPNIELDELGVPFKIAKNLTYPEIVNQYSRKKLQTLLDNGVDTYPSIIRIRKKNSLIITLTKFNKNDIELENGDVVHRHLIDGDHVLFNRQPSLHKMSMMGHRVRVMKGNTFRLNVSVTPPYNADFDGDEMNMHVPQSIETLIELREIMNVNKQIISPRENKPIITIVQDTLLGINKLTRDLKLKYVMPTQNSIINMNNTNNIFVKKDKSKPGTIKNKIVDASLFTRSQLMNILCDLSTFGRPIPEPDVKYKLNKNVIELWSGKQVLSYILPKKINLEMENSLCEDKRDKMNYVKIMNGMLEQGALDKGLFTKTSKGLIHTIFNDFGSERTKDFIDDLQKIVTYFLLLDGFSVGISDMIADDKTNRKIKKTIISKKKEIEEIMQEIHLNIFDNYTGETNQSYFESKVNSVLNKTLADTGKIGLSSLEPTNRAINMINSGSKGKATNIAQMVACLGQQNVDGKRIPYGFQGRTLPHYYKYDDSAEARGFVENSFISGQTPQEYFFHAMGGREGLIDTAVKTSETGYIQRKLMKAMEDLKVYYDFSVRTSSNIIVQFVYGNDGMDATHVESQSLYLTKLDPEKCSYGFQGLEPGSEELDEGVHFKNRGVRKTNDIYYRLEDNPFRYDAKSETHANKIGNFVVRMGYDYTQRPPIIEYIPNGILDKDTGETYFYVCWSGAHTGEALAETKKAAWIYDEYSYDNDAARQKHIAKINGSHPPALVASPQDAINHTTKLINEKKLRLEDVENYIKTTYPAVPDKGKIIATIKRKFDYRDEALYTSKDVKAFLEKKSLGTSGKIIDGVAHFACKEGYEDRQYMNALKMFGKHGVPSYFHGYTKGSSAMHDIDARRHMMIDAFENRANYLYKN